MWTRTAAWSKLKSLVGEWEGKGDMGKVYLSYELIAGGTALVERERAEKMPAMLTVYHLDGERLLLTHYCMAGNQPRMEARSFNPGSGDLEFQFVDATNMPRPRRAHAQCRDSVSSTISIFPREWRFYENGATQVDRDRAIYSGTIGETHMSQFMLLLYDDPRPVAEPSAPRKCRTPSRNISPGRKKPFTQLTASAWRGRRPRDPLRQRQAARHRRPVQRDQGGPRRLLPRSKPPDYDEAVAARDRPPASRVRRDASRSGKSGSTCRPT